MDKLIPADLTEDDHSIYTEIVWSVTLRVFIPYSMEMVPLGNIMTVSISQRRNLQMAAVHWPFALSAQNLYKTDDPPYQGLPDISIFHKKDLEHPVFIMLIEKGLREYLGRAERRIQAHFNV